MVLAFNSGHAIIPIALCFNIHVIHPIASLVKNCGKKQIAILFSG